MHTQSEPIDISAQSPEAQMLALRGYYYKPNIYGPEHEKMLRDGKSFEWRAYHITTPALTNVGHFNEMVFEALRESGMLVNNNYETVQNPPFFQTKLSLNNAQGHAPGTYYAKESISIIDRDGKELLKISHHIDPSVEKQLVVHEISTKKPEHLQTLSAVSCKLGQKVGMHAWVHVSQYDKNNKLEKTEKSAGYSCNFSPRASRTISTQTQQTNAPSVR